MTQRIETRTGIRNGQPYTYTIKIDDEEQTRKRAIAEAKRAEHELAAKEQGA